MSLASAVAGTAARAKARRLGLTEDRGQGDGDMRDAVAPRPRLELLGKAISVVEVEGVLLAVGSNGTPAPAAPVNAYLTRAFADRLGDARAAMEALAATMEPAELNRVGFRLYEAFRPEVPDGAEGWGARGHLRLERVREAKPFDERRRAPRP